MRHERADDLTASVSLEIDTHPLLAQVMLHTIGAGLALTGRRQLAWSPIGALVDLDALRANVGHQPRGRGAGKGVSEVQPLVSCQQRLFSHRALLSRPSLLTRLPPLRAAPRPPL